MRYILLSTALTIAAVAAWYSITGLMAIFSGAVIPIAIMGGALEVGKLVAASWLHSNWNQVSILLRSYLTVAVVVLMIITSMGIFGFLSKAHLQQTISQGGNNDIRIESLQRKTYRQNTIISDSEKILAQLDGEVAILQQYDRVRGPAGAIAVRASQAEERQKLNDTITAAYLQIEQLQEELLPLQKQKISFEAEIGPLKYIAEMIYGDDARNNIDSAVRIIILLLILVFDPLAVVLLIAATSQTKVVEKISKTRYASNGVILKKDEVHTIK